MNSPRITTATDLNQLGTSFCEAKIVLSAVELGVFTELAGEGRTEDELRARLELHPRGLHDFLAVLVTLGLLERDGDRYRAAPVSARYLDRNAPTYAGGFLERANHMMYPVWANLTGLLRTGEPQLAGREDQQAAFEAMMANPAHLGRFLDMMDAVSDPIGPELAAAFPFADYATVIDVGGARGNLLSHLLKAHESLTGRVFDLPAMAQPFQQHMERMSLTDRASFSGGDFFRDPIPAADVLVMGHVLHDWSPDERATLIRRAYHAVRPGGALLIYDQLTDDADTGTWNSVISLNMQLLSPGGSEYSVAECAQWLRDAGFAEIAPQRIGAHDTLVIARKAAN